MANPLLEIITSADPRIRNQSLDAVCARSTAAELLAACAELDAFRRRSDNLYERVRALFFLYAIHRFHLPAKLPSGAQRPDPVQGLRASAAAPLRGGIGTISSRPERCRSERRHLQRAGGGRISGSVSRRSPTRCAAASAPCAATNGCFAWAIPRTSRCALRPELLQRARRRHVSRSARTHAGAHGPEPFAAGATFFFSAWIFPKARGC